MTEKQRWKGTMTDLYIPPHGMGLRDAWQAEAGWSSDESQRRRLTDMLMTVSNNVERGIVPPLSVIEFRYTRENFSIKCALRCSYFTEDELAEFDKGRTAVLAGSALKTEFAIVERLRREIEDLKAENAQLRGEEL